MGIYILNIIRQKPLIRVVVRAENSFQAIERGLIILQACSEQPIKENAIHWWLATEKDSELGFFEGFILKINGLERAKYELNKNN